MRPGAEAALENLHNPEGPRTILAGEMFDFTVTIPNDAPSRTTMHWRKDGRPLPEMSPVLLGFHPAKTTDAGAYELVALRPGGEPSVGFRIVIRVVDPAIFLPVDRL